ncbi:MAG: HEAT repeat domain-containing protein [Bradymonadaceae bacterium]
MNWIMKGLTLIAMVFLVVGVAGAQEKAPDDGFEAFLKAIDVVAPAPVLEQRWSDVRERLMQAAADEERDQYTRLRATSILGNFPEKDVRTFLTTLTETEDGLIRREAFYTVGRAFGAPGDAELVELIEKGIADEDARVRAHSIRVLRWIEHADAARTLEKVAKTSDDEALRDLAALTLSRRK